MVNYSVPKRRRKDFTFFWIFDYKTYRLPRLIAAVVQLVGNITEISLHIFFKILLIRTHPLVPSCCKVCGVEVD